MHCVGFSVCGASGVAIFSARGTEVYYRIDGSRIWEEGFVRGSGKRSFPEAEVFSLNYAVFLIF